MSISEKRNQVADQCKAVHHLAGAIRELMKDYERMYRDENCKLDDLVDQVGKRTAGWMETLGNMLNGVDAVTEGDAWVDPIFAKAHELFPQPKSGA